jgi:homeobox protein cut-like
MAANVQSMVQYWRNFDLQELQRELDTTATELAQRQDESDANRKKLVEQSREFKKGTPEDVRKVVAPLLKLFQGEIDSLSKRSKNAESSFLSAYKKLIDVPDPVPVLDHCLDIQKKAHKAQDLELENKKLRETLEEYNHEFAEVKNQEVTIKSLKEKLKEYEEKMESNAQNRAKEKERELQRQFAEKERQLQETQLSVAKKLGEAEHKVATLQSALDRTQSELFDLKAKYDEATSAKSDEMEMIMADLERANERAAAAERATDQLKQNLASANQNLQQAEQMSKAPDMEQAIDILKRSSLEVELAAKEKEIGQLIEEVQRLQATVNKLRDSGASQVARLEEELSAKNRTFRMLEDRLKTQDDYEEIRRELSILKSMEFSHSSGDEASSAESKAKSLEMLLLEKNRTLQTDNTQLKVSSTDIAGPMSHPLTSTEAFASILGQELVASYQLHSQLSVESMPSPGQTTPLTNGIGPEPTSEAARCAGSGSGTPVRAHPFANSSLSQDSSTTSSNTSPTVTSSSTSGAPIAAGDVSLQRLHNIARTESSNAQTIDTAMLAQRIREILSTNNIGQRLFAKHVLGLSQGTVSELLSKPKHWDKLTEKGRESYRKMYTWSVDENNVIMLKAISPKKGHGKGSQPMMTSQYRQEDNATEERINQILSQAQSAMHVKQSQDKNQITNAMVESIYQQELAKLASQSPINNNNNNNNNTAKLHSPKDSKPSTTSATTPPKMTNGLVGGDGGRGRRPQIDSGGITQDMVAKIYREELSKLARAAEKSGNIAECTMYQQELARLAQNAKKHERMDSDREDKENKSERRDHERRDEVKREPVEEGLNLSRLKREPSEDGYDDLRSTPERRMSRATPDRRMSSEEEAAIYSHQEALRHAGSAFFLVRPRSSNHPAFPDHPSPFQMALQGGPDVSPLQRMQSIANSLMTRAHPAHQNHRPLRAVLPPITQEEFDKFGNLNTDDVVKNVKDTLSQYSISQRLFGEHCLGLSQGSVSDLLARPKPWHMLTQKGREPFIRMQIFLEDQESIPKLVANQYHISPDKLLRNHSSFDSPCSTATSPELPSPLQAMCLVQAPPTPTPSTPPMATTPINIAPQTPPMPPAMVSVPHPQGVTVQPSMYEIAAMTSELDTLAITCKVKEVLQFHNLGQKLFGEAILGLSQGSVSELLSKPKPWHMLSLKGREPFIKMHMWLNDPHNIDRLRIFQSEQKGNATDSVLADVPASLAPSRRRKSSACDDRMDSSHPAKKPRVFFSEEQKDMLRMAYAQDPYPNQATIECLAQQLGVTSKTIVNWFHNHRMRAKQQQPGTPIKGEPDDLSNHSDSVSIESSSSHYRSLHSSGGGSDGAAQWMFPTPELVSSSRRSSMNSTDSLDRATDLTITKTNYNNNRPEYKSDYVAEDLSFKDKENSAPPPVRVTSGGNRRKSAKPKWAYEGTQLDKSRSSIDLENMSATGSELEPCDLSVKKNSSTDKVQPTSPESDRESSGNKENHHNISTTSKSLPETNDMMEVMERKEKLDKLQKSLTTSSDVEEDTDWQF